LGFLDRFIYPPAFTSPIPYVFVLNYDIIFLFCQSKVGKVRIITSNLPPWTFRKQFKDVEDGSRHTFH
jgi:hypothetical protein